MSDGMVMSVRKVQVALLLEAFGRWKSEKLKTPSARIVWLMEWYLRELACFPGNGSQDLIRWCTPDKSRPMRSLSD